MQVQNEFILAIERDSFVEQVRDIIEKADEMLNEDPSMEAEGDQSMDGIQNQVRVDFDVLAFILNCFFSIYSFCFC